jgi:hypothetical protein
LRKDGSYKKSLGKIGRDLLSTFKKDYSMPNGVDGLLEKTLLIDNTPHVLDEVKNMVLVPTYNYAYIYDVTMNINHSDTSRMHRARSMILSEHSFLGERIARKLYKQYAATKSGSNTTTITNTINNNIAAPISNNSNISFRALFYAAIAERMRDFNNNKNDPLWRTLRKKLETYVTRSIDIKATELAHFMTHRVNNSINNSNNNNTNNNSINNN